MKLRCGPAQPLMRQLSVASGATVGIAICITTLLTGCAQSGTPSDGVRNSAAVHPLPGYPVPTSSTCGPAYLLVVSGEIRDLGVVCGPFGSLSPEPLGILHLNPGQTFELESNNPYAPQQQFPLPYSDDSAVVLRTPATDHDLIGHYEARDPGTATLSAATPACRGGLLVTSSAPSTKGRSTLQKHHEPAPSSATSSQNPKTRELPPRACPVLRVIVAN